MAEEVALAGAFVPAVTWYGVASGLMSVEGRQFQAELQAAQEAVVEHRDLVERLGAARSTLAAARDELARATVALAGAEAALRTLERPSPALILAALRGRRAEWLAVRRSERDDAQARVAEARTTVDGWERELTAVRAGLDALGDVDGWHAAASAAAETWALQVGARGAAELRRLAQQADEVRRELADLREVEDAVDQAGTALVGALPHLDAARSMATDERRARSWPRDRLFILSDGRKADEMDQAVGLIRKAAAALRVLAREFDEVERDRIDHLLDDDYLGTFDFLFDHRFNNRNFMDRVDGAVDRVHEALGIVEQADRRTGRRTAEVDAQLADLGRRRDRLLMSL
ncbi:hypothetical protein [Promicromonospora sp. NPDC059942]|uniref:hypothetical protein n=1 Tax=Promicromonospora sp. NPDC059942 TaxID=3347009 RepID=UPI00364728B6